MIQKLPLLAALALSGFGLYGCQTSCGEHRDPVLWADGITPAPGVYQTTAADDKWLHFPSYRAYRLPHHLGTMEIDIEAYVALEERPLAKGTDTPPGEYAIGSGNMLIVTEQTEDEIVVENSTCENDYYMLVRLTDVSAE